jgi:aminoglycoside phosphotransferase (APT) family kinase protein
LETHVNGWSEVKVTPLLTSLNTGNSGQTLLIDVAYVQGEQSHLGEFVLRGQPDGAEVVRGSDVVLQARMMDALEREATITAPHCLGVELDGEVIGVPFLVMNRLPGQPASQVPNYNVEGWLHEMSPAQRRQTWANGIRAVAQLAALDWRDGFEFLCAPHHGEPGLDQRIGYLTEWYEHSTTGRSRSIPIIDAAMDYVREHRPQETPVNVLWGDSQTANILFDHDGNVCALIDWELATLGPAECDLAWWLFFDDFFSNGFCVPRLDGLPTHEETVEIWEQAVGRKAHDLEYYEVLAGLCMALITMGAFDRLVEAGKLRAENETVNVNPITRCLAPRVGLAQPEFGPDIVEFMHAVAANFAD